LWWREKKPRMNPRSNVTSKRYRQKCVGEKKHKTQRNRKGGTRETGTRETVDLTGTKRKNPNGKNKIREHRGPTRRGKRTGKTRNQDSKGRKERKIIRVTRLPDQQKRKGKRGGAPDLIGVRRKGK